MDPGIITILAPTTNYLLALDISGIPQPIGFLHWRVLDAANAAFSYARLLRWLSNLRHKCALPVKDELLPELAEFSPGPALLRNTTAVIWSPVNVVIADYVEMDDAVFPKTIKQLNMKLLLMVTIMGIGYLYGRAPIFRIDKIRESS